LTEPTSVYSLLFFLSSKAIVPENDIFYNKSVQELISCIKQRDEGHLLQSSAVSVNTGKFTGRSPYDKYIVADSDRASIWWCKTTKPMTSSQYAQIRGRLVRHLIKRSLFVQDCSVGQDPKNQYPLTIVTETAWHSLFSKNIFLPPSPGLNQSDRILLLHAPTCQAHPETDRLASPVFIIINLDRNEILIGGTAYAGEIKKSIFTLMNYRLPKKQILSMHCSANVGRNQDVALFFGLSGTGKTTLSSDPDRLLIGDDEHGWSDEGIFNLEGGCYAKTARLSKELEPDIWQAVEQKGSVLENVVVDPDTGLVNYNDLRYTENTRATYPLQNVTNRYLSPIANPPTNIFFLTADAFGVFPPAARLDYRSAIYYFLAGYTSKIAGTETNIQNSPSPTFSPCFAAPFIPCPPQVYADLLFHKLTQFQPGVWLVNSGWYGDAYRTGSRYPLEITRRIIRAVLDGSMDNIEYHHDMVFELEVPSYIPGVPENMLNPRTTWRDQSLYDQYAYLLKDAFAHHMKQFNLDRY
jgi:phosphoenolpyruvate carboxykinase (ATP)